MGPLDIEAESFVGSNGQQFTSLRILEAARLRKQEQMGQKESN